MRILGIDPGKSGGYCILDEKFRVVHAEPTEVDPLTGFADPNQLKSLIVDYKVKAVIIELIHAISGSRASATFSFGGSFGVAVGVSKSLVDEIHLVPPKKWQLEAWRGGEIIKKGKKIDTKETSRVNALRFMEESERQMMFPSKRSKKEHDGIIDAYHISRYYLLKLI